MHKFGVLKVQLKAKLGYNVQDVEKFGKSG